MVSVHLNSVYVKVMHEETPVKVQISPVFDNNTVQEEQYLVSWMIRKGKEKSPGSATITSRRQSLPIFETKRKRRHKPTRAKPANAQKVNRPALSSQARRSQC